MSLTLPGLGKGKHRGLTPHQLVKKVSRLEREADDHTCQLVGLATEIDELKAERNELEQQLDTAGIELSGAREDLAEAEQELTELRAFKANVCSVSDLSAQQGPVAPAPTADRFNTGPVRRAGASPHAAHIPAWVTPELQAETDAETTVSIPLDQLPQPAPAA